MEKILSILLPTYNRARCIGEQLKRLSLLDKETLLRVEIIVSDNCSPDNTQAVVESYKGELDFTYIRNKKNIGPDGNFMQCLNKATAKYAWLLGDDDFLEYGNLSRLLDSLDNGDYGLVHIKQRGDRTDKIQMFTNSEDFLVDIGVWITFISANIVNRKYLNTIDLKKYVDTFFLQMPLYISCAIHSKENLMVNYKMVGCDGGNQNGGYNIFQVFIVNYLNIFKEFIEVGKIDESFYKREVKVSKEFLLPFIYRILIRKERTGWSSENAWKILSEYYGFWRIRFDIILYIIVHLPKLIAKEILRFVGLRCPLFM